MFDKNTQNAYIRMMFGERAIQIPFNFIRQNSSEDSGLIIAPERGTTLSFGSKKMHVLVLGDMVFRPRLVIESDHLKGMGAAGIVTQGFDADAWEKNGKIIYKI